MNYTTLMVHLHVGMANTAVLKVAHTLAVAHKAAVIGVGVVQNTQRLHEEDYAFFGGLIEKYLPARAAAIEAAETEFRTAMQGISEIEFRLGETYHTVTEYVAEEARGADLVIVSADQTIKAATQSFNFDLAEMLAMAGRPVLVVPKVPKEGSGFSRGMIYWKDSVETRRAVTGALPLLQQATYVSLVRTVSDGDLETAVKQMALVTQWLKRHDVPVHPMVLDSEGNASATLRATALEQDAEFIVAGTYTQNRGLRERVFGGVTRDMLRHIDRYVLLSH